MAARKADKAEKVLAVNVTVTDDEGRGTTYMAGTEVPAEVAEKITNPKAWAQPESDGEESQDSES